MLHEGLTEKIIGAFYHVYNELGFGFVESVYENALKHELIKRGMRVTQQTHIKVFYDGVVVGNFAADLVVNGVVILELKAVKVLAKAHEKQLSNYLKASNVEVGLLLNFGGKPEFTRRIYTKNLKTHKVTEL